ncbi:MAG: sigma-70 family RNA polymerase sigma factor [Vicinamibacteria bacterium]
MTTTALDIDLLSRIALADQTALGEFFDRHSGRVRGTVQRILRKAGDVDDVIQEVFMQVWRQADRFDAARGNPMAWLTTIARSRALDRVRRYTSRREDAPSAIELSAPKAPCAVLAMGVRRALSALSSDQRTAIELAYWQGLTQSEIAERLGEPLGTVKTRIRTALLQLRKVMGCDFALPQAA